MKKWENFTRQEIEYFVKESYSWATLASKIGYCKDSGSCVNILKSMIQELNLDISHFTGQGWNNNNFDYERFRNGVALQPSKSVNALVYLRGRQCEQCGSTEWLENPIPLEVHHIDGDSLNNEMDNLKLLCPNCHALTDNYCGKNINGIQKVSDRDFVVALQENPNIRQALRKLGLSAKGGNYQRARELIFKHNITHLMQEHQDGKPLE